MGPFVHALEGDSQQVSIWYAESESNTQVYCGHVVYYLSNILSPVNRFSNHIYVNLLLIIYHLV